ncbi:MAG: epimerase [Gemmatimonadetes bacterium]|nr:epimerase [Gemmatimonadota bacterium]
MHVLVTGGAGFIGSHVVDRLLARGERVTAVDNFDGFYPTAVKRSNLVDASRHSGFELIEGDIRDEPLLRRLCRGIDLIVHLAARAGVRPSIENPALYFDVNVRGSLGLFETAKAEGVRRVVVASSSSVYGNYPEIPFREDLHLQHPISPYAASKLACEQLAYTYHHLYGMEIVNLRFFTAYGPRQRPEMAIHKFVRAIEAGSEIVLFGHGSRRDYTYVEDIVDGVEAAMERPEGYEILNLGNSAMVELDELISRIERALGKKARIKRADAQPGDVDRTCADLGRSAAVLGYSPKIGIDEGLKRFVSWYRDRG